MPETCEGLEGEELRQIYSQIGEVLQGLRGVAAMIEVRHRQSEKLHDLARADLVTLRQEHRDLAEKVDCVVCVMQHDLEGLRADAAAGGRAIDSLVAAVQDMRDAVAEITTLRSRLAGLLLGLGLLGSIIVWLAEPFYRWAIEKQYFRQ